MTKPFHELRETLLRAGVAPRHVRRYLRELSDHLSDLCAEELRAGRSPADAESAALLRLGSAADLAEAMIAQRRFQSWTARAPWATLAVAPVLFLAAAWWISCLILWTGWNVFLPDSPTPFVSIHGLEILLFGVGRSIYFGAPIVIGWAVALIAARQRVGVFRPLSGLAAIAWLAAAAQVHVSRSAEAASIRHVGIGLFPAASAQGFSAILLHAGIVLSVTAVPYLIWRLRQAATIPD